MNWLVTRVLFLALVVAGACAQFPLPDEGKGGASPAGAFDVAGRSTALALLASDANDSAIEAYRALIAADGRFGFDLVNLALAHLKRNENKDALALLDQAAKVSPHPSVPYLRGLALKRLRQYEEALAAFGEALRAQPGCREAHLQIGLVHEIERRLPEAEAAFQKVLDHDPVAARRHAIAHNQAMYLAHKHLSLAALEAGKDDEADKHTEEAQKFGGASPPQEQSLDLGPCAAALDLASPSVTQELAKAGVALPAACSVPPLEYTSGPWRGPGPGAPISLSAVAWTTAGADALWIGNGSLIRMGAEWKPGAAPGPGRPLASGDLDGDGHEDVVVVMPAGVVEVRTFPPGRYDPVAFAGVGGATAAIAMDQDHDGDLDVIVAGRMGERPGLYTFQNQTKPGATSPAFGLVSHEQVGLTTSTPAGLASLGAGDLDEANDLDLVAFFSQGPPVAYLSRRQGRFEKATIAGPSGAGAGVVADVTGDGLLDLAYPTAKGAAVLAGRGDGTFESAVELPVEGGLTDLQAEDLDGDTRPDLVGTGVSRRLIVMLAQGAPGATTFAAPDPKLAAQELGGPPLIVDLDRDGGLDMILPEKAFLMNGSAARAGHLLVTLNASGGLANSRGVGGRIWVRTGGRIVRREVRHAGELFSLGGCGRADLVRVQWTNGVLQHHLAEKPGGGKTTVVASGGQLGLLQPAGLSGSCPYLYSDAGEGLAFVTDVLAGAPLGLPGANGRPVPSSPRELIALPRGTWAPVNGRYRFRVTEEYREVTYLDQALLYVVDHPRGSIPLADGGIGAPPEHASLVFADRVEPVKAARHGERDVTGELAAVDGKHWEPPRGIVQGLAPEHALELTLPAPRPGEVAWLVLTGFVFWTDAGLNTRLAQADARLSAPPRLEVPDGRGGWREALPFMRFPAGRSKTALVDVTGILDAGDPRVRIVGSMRIYLDHVALATAASPQAARTISGALRIAPAKDAQVVHHGIAPLGPDPGSPPWTLDATRRRSALEGSWIVPRGWYTRYGDVLPLLGATDDRYVVIGPGDGVDLAFDVPEGPAAGMERDLFLEFTGWDKDAHPATWAGATVEPLPYRGMPEYGPGSSFAKAKQHELRKAHARWNTRWREGAGGTQP